MLLVLVYIVVERKVPMRDLCRLANNFSRIFAGMFLQQLHNFYTTYIAATCILLTLLISGGGGGGGGSGLDPLPKAFPP